MDLIAFSATMTAIAVLAVGFIGTHQKWAFWALWATPIFAVSIKAFFTFKDLRISKLKHPCADITCFTAFALATVLSFTPLLAMARSELTSDDDAMFLFLGDIKATNDNLMDLAHDIKNIVEKPNSADETAEKTTESIRIEVPATQEKSYHVYVNGHRIFVDVMPATQQ